MPEVDEDFLRDCSSICSRRMAFSAFTTSIRQPNAANQLSYSPRTVLKTFDTSSPNVGAWGKLRQKLFLRVIRRNHGFWRSDPLDAALRSYASFRLSSQKALLLRSPQSEFGLPFTNARPTGAPLRHRGCLDDGRRQWWLVRAQAFDESLQIIRPEHDPSPYVHPARSSPLVDKVTKRLNAWQTEQLCCFSVAIE